MANILDLLLDYKNVTRRNPDISMLYIAYQTLLMVSSILTPGTIFLMIIGAINLAFPTLNLYWCLLINVIPIVIFVLLIFFAKSETQVIIVLNDVREIYRFAIMYLNQLVSNAFHARPVRLIFDSASTHLVLTATFLAQ